MARLTDGFSTTMTFNARPNLLLWEITVTPPGLDGGGANDTTTMRNSVWRTRQPKKLKTLTEFTFTAAYDPIVYDDFVAIINLNQNVTVNFPDGRKLNFYGWVDKFVPNEHREGEQPTVTVTVVPSNMNPAGVEAVPTRT